ncbi:DNA primase [Pueribacillus theae]|uniref:DNA primase n=1 Tax=Pueribacillus theae TaxID=2171751 RepID=A0A2U1K4W2_9BACI|nr:DNA primase [Pueribacillus theae]PWA12546.1 DNA primase [Pueribacillus theae]
MGNRIPEETIEKIRRTVDIVDIVSEYIPLKKQGRNYFGLCPFHGEKTPSFSVAPDKQIFHCFGCKAGGNVYTFLMDIEGWSFLEAVHHLAEKAGIDVPKNVDSQAPAGGNSKHLDTMKKMHGLLAKLYHYCLTETDFGKDALAYLDKRGIAKNTIETFQIGFSPDSWEFSTSFLARRGFSLDDAEKAGLLSKRNFDGKLFDRFRNRIMFPIQNAKGETIAFGARILGKGEPKYLNSPETPIFNKSKTLYGLHLARSSIRSKRQAVLFEGYIDVISAWKAGVTNAVATLGTSLTEEQAKQIRRTAETVVVCYDSDEAGVSAALRASEVLESAGCYVKIAKMPDGYDPDDYIQTYGPKKFLGEVIAQASTQMSFKMETLRRGKNLLDEGERIRYVEEVLQEISRLPKAVERDHYLRQLADEFSLSLDALKKQQFQYYLQSKRKMDKDFNMRNAKSEKSLAANRLLPAYQNAERLLLAHMMKSDEVAYKVREAIGGSFNVEAHSALAAYIYAFYEKGYLPNVSALLETIDDKQVLQTASELAIIELNDELSDEELQDYIHSVETYPKWLSIKEKVKEKNEAERRNDFIAAAQIAKEIIEMKKALKMDKHGLP